MGIIENPAIFTWPIFFTTVSGTEPRQHPSRPIRGQVRQRADPVRELLKIQQSFQGTMSPGRDPEGNRDNTHLDQSGKSSAAEKSGPGNIGNPATRSGSSFFTTGSGREPRQHLSVPIREKIGGGEIRSGEYWKSNHPFRGPCLPGGIRKGTETTPI